MPPFKAEIVAFNGTLISIHWRKWIDQLGRKSVIFWPIHCVMCEAGEFIGRTNLAEHFTRSPSLCFPWGHDSLLTHLITAANSVSHSKLSSSPIMQPAKKVIIQKSCNTYGCITLWWVYRCVGNWRIWNVFRIWEKLLTWIINDGWWANAVHLFGWSMLMLQQGYTLGSINSKSMIQFSRSSVINLSFPCR